MRPAMLNGLAGGTTTGSFENRLHENFHGDISGWPLVDRRVVTDRREPAARETFCDRAHREIRASIPGGRNFVRPSLPAPRGRPTATSRCAPTCLCST